MQAAAPGTPGAYVCAAVSVPGSMHLLSLAKLENANSPAVQTQASLLFATL